MEKAILKTLAYADIFDYPLTEAEIRKWLIEKKVDDVGYFRQSLARLVAEGKIGSLAQFYFLPGRTHLLTVRQRRKKASLQKIKLAQKVAARLKLIAWIKMVAVSGALAVDNAREEDDIDLMIVTAADRLWLTRLSTIFLAELFARRRRPEDSEFADKICLNVFLDEGRLVMDKEERDLYFAHEVAQARPLWDRGGTYRTFIEKNTWIADFLPNWQTEGGKKAKEESSHSLASLLLFLNPLASLLELLAFWAQRRYMAKRRTREIVSPTRAFFHPFDYRIHTLLEYQKRLEKLRLS